MKKQRTYSIDVRSLYPDYDDYYNVTKKFGEFSADGKSYTIFDGNTPRQWMNLLFNGKFASIIANHGEGYTAFGRYYVRVTRYHNPELYLIRELDGKRILTLTDKSTGEVIDLFGENITCTVMPGCSVFSGKQNGISFEVKVFVPQDYNCECWLVNVKNEGSTQRELTLHAQQTWVFHNGLCWGNRQPSDCVKIEDIENGYAASSDKMGLPYDKLYGCFAVENCTNKYHQAKSEITLCTSKANPPIYKNFTYNFANVFSDISLSVGEQASRSAVSSADENEVGARLPATELCNSAAALQQFENNAKYWEDKFSANTCNIPDKNMQHFLNTWLKYQLAMTNRYSRGEYNGNYRDVLQDAWGGMFNDVPHSKSRILEALKRVYPSGRAMRSFDTEGGISMPQNFIDCPLWAHCAISQYIKETGDFTILDEVLPYFESDEVGTVEDHLLRMLEYPFTNRGKNGLVLMFDGDWLDGLTGINQNGTATSCWATIQAFWAQNHMADIYEAKGEAEKAKLWRERSEEYREIVRNVGWDGKWYVYGFKSDGLPVGSAKCSEGKIFLNPNTWAIFTGLETDEKRIELIRNSIFTYLSTPYGSLLNYPPYVNDRTCGRLSTQVPGTFANSAIYLHGASFDVFSRTKLHKTEEAQDLFARLIPGHIDNPDCRRTSEPYCTGNVHYGPNNERFGMNLFSWFTATPAWLIHAGFDEILGVKAGFNGLTLEPCVPDSWNEFTVNRRYRGKDCVINFHRSGEKSGIYKNGEKIDENTISLENIGGEFDFYFC